MTKNGRGPTGRQARGAPVFQAVAGLAQTRLTVLSGITENVDWLFVEQPPEDKVLVGQGDAARRGRHPRLSGRRLSQREWTAEVLRSGQEEAATEHGLKLAKAQAPVRVAVTGRTIGLPLFELVELLDRKRTLARIDAAAAKLTQEAQIGPSGR